MKFTTDTTGFAYALGAIAGMSKTAQDKKFVSTVMESIFAELDDEFTLRVDAAAIASPKTLHHVYEWGNVGQPGSRLWQTVLTGSPQTKVATVIWLPSNKPVPVDPKLLEPGPNGKSVAKDAHTFVWKAPVMESGLNVTIYPQHSDNKTLAFIGSDGELHFSKKPVTVNPGGHQTTMAFTTLYQTFWSRTAPGLMAGTIQPRIQKRLDAAGAKAMNNKRRVFTIKSDPYAYHAGENLGLKEWAEVIIELDKVTKVRRVISHAT